MHTKLKAITDYKASLSIGIFAVISLLGCEHQPKSLFEQQAEAESSNIIELDKKLDTDEQVADITEFRSNAVNKTSLVSIRIDKQQAIARQSDCDPIQRSCQYFELNILSFTPAQPWLSSIMWQNIARVLSPEAPLTSQDQAAKDTVLKLFNQIEYDHKIVSSLPLYLRIDTELVLNPNTNRPVVNDNVALKSSSTNNISTGYMLIRSSQQHSTVQQQQLNYVMLDMQRKLQLRVEDILLPQVTTDDLLQALQTPKRDWLVMQGVEQKYLADWPLPLSDQWYLDQQGLHMIYQSEDLLDIKPATVDLLVSYTALKGLIKPDYIVKATIQDSR